MSEVAVLRPSEITSRADSTPQFSVGKCVYDSTGNKYRYVQVTDVTVATAVGKLAYFTDTTGTKVTCDSSGGDGLNCVAGVFTKAGVTVNYYTFIQVAGIATLVTDGGDDIAKNDPLISGTDGVVDRITAAGIVRVIGYALADDVNADDTVVAQLVGLG